MFDEARDDDAVLLLDEADSFLRDRRGAQRSWEVTQVNELLTQMEDFQGLFICATNLLDELDEASLRRFDLKIKFGFLQPDQAWILFRQTLKQHGSALKAAKKWKSRLADVDNLTPGDFATVVRQNRLTRKPITPEMPISPNNGWIYAS
jgi:AAA+ superfamily predicted ATPase